MKRMATWAVGVWALAAALGCGANAQRIGAECANSGQCENEELTCLTQFSGGYCGASGCTKDADCPSGSMCVTHTDGANYCFLVCNEKVDCNQNRSAAFESNCSSNITRVEGGTQKACVPPSGG